SSVRVFVTWPVPSQVGHMAPRAIPVPPQVSHCAGVWSVSLRVVPSNASFIEIRASTSRSSPRMGRGRLKRLRLAVLAPSFPKRRLKKSENRPPVSRKPSLSLHSHEPLVCEEAPVPVNHRSKSSSVVVRRRLPDDVLVPISSGSIPASRYRCQSWPKRSYIRRFSAS